MENKAVTRTRYTSRFLCLLSGTAESYPNSRMGLNSRRRSTALELCSKYWIGSQASLSS